MNAKPLTIALACVLGAGLSALSPTSALAHKDRGTVVERHRPERVLVRPHHYRYAYRPAPRVVYVVPARPLRYRYYDYDYGYSYPRYGDTLDLGLHTGPYGTYLNLGAGIRLE